MRRVIFSDSLYSTDAAGYVEFIRAAPDGDQVLVVGHNPMMEDLAMALSGDGDDRARSALVAGFPASALAVIRFAGGLSQTAPGKGYLEAFLTPADLVTSGRIRPQSFLRRPQMPISGNRNPTGTNAWRLSPPSPTRR